MNAPSLLPLRLRSSRALLLRPLSSSPDAPPSPAVSFFSRHLTSAPRKGPATALPRAGAPRGSVQPGAVPRPLEASAAKPFSTSPASPSPQPWYLKLADFFSATAPVIRLSESLFASVKLQTTSSAKFHREGKVRRDFKSKHMLIVLHTWMIHRRLIAGLDGDADDGKLLQEQLFDRLWDDTTTRIRAQNLPELTVNTHLKNVQK